MAFERAKIEVKPAATGTGIKVSLAKMRGAPAKMKLSVSNAIASGQGWRDGDKLEVLIGKGEHHGIIRIRKNNSTGDAVVKFRSMVKGRSYFQIGLGHQAAFVDRTEPGKWCGFEVIEDGFVEIVLPRWADETAPKKKSADTLTGTVPVRPASVVPVHGRGGASVTGSIMGDPPPGRREMLAKVGDL